MTSEKDESSSKKGEKKRVSLKRRDDPAFDDNPFARYRFLPPGEEVNDPDATLNVSAKELAQFITEWFAEPTTIRNLGDVLNRMLRWGRLRWAEGGRLTVSSFERRRLEDGHSYFLLRDEWIPSTSISLFKKKESLTRDASPPCSHFTLPARPGNSRR